VGYAINPSDIAFLRGANGKVRADFDLVVFVYDPDGVVVNSIAETIHVAGTLEDIKQQVAHGVHYSQQISAPAKGQFFFRIAVRDLNRDHYGAVELAASEVRNLTAPSIPPAPPAPTPRSKPN
jgi:hypothetical protein